MQTHSVLVSHGVEAELHVWEGLGHAFFFDLNLPQSDEVYEVPAKSSINILDSSTQMKPHQTIGSFRSHRHSKVLTSDCGRS